MLAVRIRSPACARSGVGFSNRGRMPPLTTLRPIIVIKEGNNGLGMQLRLVAGPISDAAAAAKICAAMIENDRPCTTTVFEGQRLAVNTDEPGRRRQSHAATRPMPSLPPPPNRPCQKHYTPKRTPQGGAGSKNRNHPRCRGSSAGTTGNIRPVSSACRLFLKQSRDRSGAEAACRPWLLHISACASSAKVDTDRADRMHHDAVNRSCGGPASSFQERSQ